MTVWRPVVDVDACPDCGEPYDREHLIGCEIGEIALRTCLTIAEVERRIDEARDDRQLGEVA